MVSMTDLQRTDQARGRPILAISLGYFMVMLDMTVLTVALPAIRHELGGGIAGLQWVVDGYVLIFAALLLSAGSAADRLGPRRTFQLGCWLFALSSALAGASPSLAVLIVLRAIQGIGAAGLLPASMALIAAAFPDPSQRARALGAWAAISGCALAAGPLIGGSLIGTLGWRAIFFINLPVAGLGALLTRRWMPSDRAPQTEAPFDLAGQLLAVVTLAALTFGFTEAGRLGLTADSALLGWAAALLAGAAFVWVEGRSAHPMLPPGLLRIRAMAVGLVLGVVVNAVLAGALFVMALSFEQARGWSPLLAGVGFLPLTIPTAFNPLMTGRLVARVGSRPPMLVGFICSGLGCALSAVAGNHRPYALVALGLALLGTGVSLILPALIAQVVAAAPAQHVGVASGALNAVRQVGAVVSVAVTGAVLTTGDQRASAAPAALWVLASAALAGVVVLGLGARPLRRSQRVGGVVTEPRS
jgi:DHA2 family methylenomycin A resistance protein-like MFS transporter